MTTARRRVLAAASIVAAGLGATACGSEGISVPGSASPNVHRGAQLFSQRCAGCHTFDVAGTQGGASQVHDRERTDGPNFNVRKETRDSVLYAIRNGGFSGAIMPENIVVGPDANDVAAFVSQFAGREQKPTVSPPPQPLQAQTSTNGSTGTTSTPEAGTTSTAQGGAQQAAAQGKQVFTKNCAGCHTLKDANATGQVGPNLDQLKPDAARVERQVTNGGAQMPAFKGILSQPEVKAVAQYVSSVAGKS
jgi:mono/diheme cytochrome c family protein